LGSNAHRFFRSSVVRNALSLYGIQAANYVLPWFTFPYMLRVIGVEKFGAIAFAQAFVSYFDVVTRYGFDFTATREISIHRDDARKLSQIFTATLIAKTILMTLSLVVFSATVLLIPRFRQDARLFFITFTVVIANVIFPQWLFQGIEKMEHITYREVGGRLLGLAPIFLFVHRPSDYLIAAGIQSGSLLVAAIAGYVGFQKITTARLVPVPLREIKRTFVEGWHVFLSTAAITLYTRSNTFVLGIMASDRDVGYFSAAQRLVEAGRALVFPLTTAIFPHISRLSHESPQKAIAFIERNTLRLTAPFALISIIWIAGAPWVGRVLFGPKFGPSVPLLRIMAPIPLFVAIGSIYATYYMLGMGYKKQWSQLIISAGAFNFVVLVPLLVLTPPTLAVSITCTLVEAWVMAGAWIFYKVKNRAA
jgi:PST family polysaccharide transporter